MKQSLILFMFALLLTVLVGLPAGADPGSSGPPHRYRLGPNDVIRIQVFGEEDLTMETRIGSDGRINYPLLGEVAADGRTLQDLQEHLTNRLAAGYIRHPKVSVQIVRHRSFYVTGEVRSPGGFPYEQGVTVQKAITMAGGFTDKAERRDLKLSRTADGRQETLSAGPDTPVGPDDTVIVAQAQKFYVNGEVRKPGEYAYEKGLTVHKAITMAGGFTDKASERRTKVLRMVNGHEQAFKVKLEDVVLPDDLILVPQSIF